MGRAEAGLEAGIAEGAKNVGLAAGLGGALGGAMTGIGEMIRAGRAAPKEVAAVRDALDADTRAEFDTAIEIGRDEAAAFADPPAGITPEEVGAPSGPNSPGRVVGRNQNWCQPCGIGVPISGVASLRSSVAFMAAIGQAVMVS